MIAKAGRRLPLSLRLSAMITLLAIGAMSLLSLVILSKQSVLQSEQLQDLGHGLVTQMASAMTEAVFTNDETSLQVQVQKFSELPRVRALQVSDQQKVLASAGNIKQLSKRKNSEYFFRGEIRFKEVIGGEVKLLLRADSLGASYTQMLRLVVGMICFISVVAVVLAYVISRRISKPIGVLLNAISGIGNKDFERQPPKEVEQRTDELGQLIQAVNQMSHGLYQKGQIEQRLAGFVNKEIADRIINELDSVHFGGERVDATVMFADIVGFTGMSERMPPEKVAALLNEYFYYSTQCAKRYSGTIDKFIGDCVMMLFGAPIVDQNHHFHAVACAIMINRLLEKLNIRHQQQGFPAVQLRIGINSGEMVAGLLGSADKMEYSVVGDAVNLASRLCSEASPGQVLISESHYQQLIDPNLLIVKKHQPLLLKGKQRPVNSYLVEGLAPEPKARIDTMIDEILNVQRDSS